MFQLNYLVVLECSIVYLFFIIFRYNYFLSSFIFQNPVGGQTIVRDVTIHLHCADVELQASAQGTEHLRLPLPSCLLPL